VSRARVVLYLQSRNFNVWATRRLRPGSVPWKRPFVFTDKATAGGNTTIGKEVRLFDDKTKIGTIAYTFDAPSSVLPYPAGYRCDLSLISDPHLPTMHPAPGQPKIVGWADLAEVMNGGRLFMTAYLVDADLGEGWGLQEGIVLSSDGSEALLEGVQYLWEREYMSQNMSLLWRTVSDEWNIAYAGGYSGAVLCLGNPCQVETQAIVYQNFAELWRTRLVSDVGSVWIKGGFILPPMIYNSTIECGPRLA
jgi:hypothetical protein